MSPKIEKECNEGDIDSESTMYLSTLSLAIQKRVGSPWRTFLNNNFNPTDSGSGKAPCKDELRSNGAQETYRDP